MKKTQEESQYEETNYVRIMRVCQYGDEYGFSGVDFGGKITMHYREGNKVVFRVAGHTGWNGVGCTKYYSPQYLIGTIGPIENSHKKNINKYTIGIFRCVIEIHYSRKTMKKAKERIAEVLSTL